MKLPSRCAARIFKVTSGLRLLPLVLPSVALAANPPQWWTTVSPSLVSRGDNQPLGVANLGQAKYMAKCALDTLRFIDPVRADAIAADLVGVGKPIPAWTLDAPGTPQAIALSSPLLVGQLKAIAAPFYSRLDTSEHAWLAAERATNGTQDAAAPSNIFPWTSATADDANKAVATVGQLKAVFSLRFETLAAAQVDSDGDGMLDWKERRYFGALDHVAAEDFDGDGLTNAQELALGTNLRDIDTDGDGVPDGFDGNPTEVNVANFYAGTLMVTSPLR